MGFEININTFLILHIIIYVQYIPIYDPWILMQLIIKCENNISLKK